LADELLAAYEELRGRYFRRDFRPGVLEAGRFAEAAWRILELHSHSTYTAIGKTLPGVPDLLKLCENADPLTVHESMRLHIPRALAAVYNVRNRRDVGHIAADVDANVMDAEYVVGCCSWVLAEFIRLFHSCSPAEAQSIVEALVKRQAPLVQIFGNGPFVLNPALPAREEILLLLYHQGAEGASLSDLDAWLPSISRRVISARLPELEKEHRHLRRVDGRAYITDTGAAYVERNVLPA
jgi:hypothetical protein